MNHDPKAWARLGAALRGTRESRGLTRQELAELLVARGVKITPRTIANLETGVVPKKGVKPPSAEPVAAALGWKPGWVDRILSGEDVEQVLGEHAQERVGQTSMRGHALELLPAVYEFSRIAGAAGADPVLRDEFERMAQRLLAFVPAGVGASGGSAYGLVAYRPHAPGEGIPADDVARIEEAFRREG